MNKGPVKTPRAKGITVWDRPEAKVVSAYGNVAYRTWCKLEQERFKKKGALTHIAEEDGYICLMHGRKQ